MKKSLKDRILYFCLAIGLGITAAALPMIAAAQTATSGQPSSGNTMAFNRAVQGENAGTVEGTVENIMNWVGNVICPFAAVGAGVHTVMQLKAGGKWMPSAATAVGLLSISGLMRLAEFFITNATGTTSGAQ
jgi:hypothetical protein